MDFVEILHPWFPNGHFLSSKNRIFDWPNIITISYTDSEYGAYITT